MISRLLYQKIHAKLRSGKAIIILGARQTGKTTLVRELIKENPFSHLFLNADEPHVQSLLDHVTVLSWKQIIGSKTLVIIDEAQRIRNIGVKLKLITDQLPEIQLVITGSSSLELANEINEPLTGRKWEYFLYPLSWEELKTAYSYHERLSLLEQRLVFGMYPEIVTHTGQEVELLHNLSGSYLYKDLLSFKGIRKPELIQGLLKALALQIGSEVSYNELSGLLKVDKNTIMTYINLLEQAFIIFRLEPLSRNMRKEISSTRKFYFYDNGLRNALIANFNPLSLRNDVGQLWENFLVSERIKYNHYHDRWVNRYFWRTTTQQEIDYIEESGGSFELFEFKWSPAKKKKFPDIFLKSYAVSGAGIISYDNFESFI
ncbi:MAG: ATP-binding protein [Bacteroidales bacterium]